MREQIKEVFEKLEAIKQRGLLTDRQIDSLDQSLALLRPLAEEPPQGEFTKRIRTEPYNPKWKHTVIIRTEDRDKLCGIIDRQAAELKELSDTVQINCNPPDDCNDPVVLKTYMKACFDKAMEKQDAKLPTMRKTE